MGVFQRHLWAGKAEELIGVMYGVRYQFLILMPVAIVQDATLPSQRPALCTLDCLHQTLTEQRMASPCVLLIGDVLRGLASLGQTNETVLAQGRI